MKNTTLPLVFFISLTMLFYSCGVNNKTNEISTNDNPQPLGSYNLSTEYPPKETENTNDGIKLISDAPEVTNRMIVKTGTMNMETEKYDETINHINDYIKKSGGFITNSSSSINQEGKKYGSLTIRIGSDKYDAMVKDMNNFGKVLKTETSGKDVTSEYIDLQARLNTQSELEKRLLTLLNEKTAKLTDVVEVEEKLSNVRESIEKTQGRMKFLKNQTDFSTFTISVYEPYSGSITEKRGFFYEIGRGFSRGAQAFTEILSATITAVIGGIPIIASLLAIIFLLKFILKKFISSRIKKA